MERTNESTPRQSCGIENLLFWIAVIAFLLGILWWQVAPKIRIPKKRLVDVYGIDKKSFNKWVRFFCSDIVRDLETYNRRRTVSQQEYLAIIHRLGHPSSNRILSKKEIVDIGEGTYRSLRECVKRYPDAFGLPSFEAFLRLQKFPPTISKRLLEQYA